MSEPTTALAETKILTSFELDPELVQAAKLKHPELNVATFEGYSLIAETAKERYRGIDVETRDGFALAIEGRALFRSTRIAIDKRRKQLTEDARVYTKRVNNVGEQITELFEPFEKELDAKIKKVEEARENRKAAEREAAAEAERQRLLAEQEAERQRLAAEREAIEAEKKAMAEWRAKQEAEAQARREAEELERKAREEAEQARAVETGRRMFLLNKLAATHLPGTEFDQSIQGGLDKWELQNLESHVAAKELESKNIREAAERLAQAEREQREAAERAAAEARAAEEQRLAQQRADIEAREAAIAAKERADREAAEEQARKERQERFGLLACLVGIGRDYCSDERDDPYHRSKIWWKFREGYTGNDIESDDELVEPFASMPIGELRQLVANQTAQRKARDAERARVEAEERAVAEAERQAALAKRREALRPDSYKLRDYANSIRTVPIPEFSDDAEITLTVNTASEALCSIADSLEATADQIVGKEPKFNYDWESSGVSQ